jgi:acetyl esterase
LSCRPVPYLVLTLILGIAPAAAAAGPVKPGVDPARAHLDPETRAVLSRASAGPYVDLMTLPPVERRRGQDQFFGPLGLPASGLTAVEERTIPSRGGPLRIRIYRPYDTGAGPQPVMIYFHGGGMSMGSLEQYEGLCQRMSAKSGVTIVSVDYRLTPEHHFPAPLEDAYDALTWVHDNARSLNLDAARLAVGGDSAGGNLAAALTLADRDLRGPPIRFQLLIYPAVGTSGHSQSMKMFASGYLFGATELQEAIEQYVPDPAQRGDPWALPIRQTDFHGLPPAFIISAEYEIMRDDIEEYGARLRAGGAKVEMHRYLGTVHPFLSMAGVIGAGRAAIDESAEKLRAGLGG